MCLVHDKSSEIFAPMYLTFLADWSVRLCSLKSCKMGFFFFCNVDDLAFIRIKSHKSLLLPGL